MAPRFETLSPGGFILSSTSRSRESAQFAPNLSIVIGQVLGKSSVAAPTFAPAASNSGVGAVTPDPTNPVRSDAIDGVYQIIVVSDGPTAAFDLRGPNSEIVVGRGMVGTVFDGPLKFVVNDDGSHFYAKGDVIDAQVLRPLGMSGIWGPFNPNATDGTERAAGIAISPIRTDASGGAASADVITREATVRASDLTWPAGITAEQQAEAIKQLKKLRIELQ